MGSLESRLKRLEARAPEGLEMPSEESTLAFRVLHSVLLMRETRPDPLSEEERCGVRRLLERRLYGLEPDDEDVETQRRVAEVYMAEVMHEV